MNDSPKHKRRSCRFSLRTLLVVMTLFTVTVGCFVGWVQYRRQRARENRARVAEVEEAVAAIEKLGGKVTSAYEKRRSQTWLETQFDDPGDVDDPIGVLKVTIVDLSHTSVTDAGLEHLRRLTKLEHLKLNNTKVTDAGLEHLRRLTALRSLNLPGCRSCRMVLPLLTPIIPNHKSLRAPPRLL